MTSDISFLVDFLIAGFMLIFGTSKHVERLLAALSLCLCPCDNSLITTDVGFLVNLLTDGVIIIFGLRNMLHDCGRNDVLATDLLAGISDY